MSDPPTARLSLRAPGLEVLTNNAARNVKLAIQRMADSGDAVAAAAHCIDAAAKLAVPGRGQDEQR